MIQKKTRQCLQKILWDERDLEVHSRSGWLGRRTHGQLLAVGILSVCCLAVGLGVNAEETEVLIKKVKNRSEAVVTTKPPPKVDDAQNQKSAGVRPIETAEAGTVGMAQTSVGVIGKGTDQTVETVQKMGGSIVARFFRAMDFMRREDNNAKS